MTINVLIADDSKVVLQLLQSILTAEEDINVIACAENGVQAIELVKRFKPDLITMDVMMPKMDGVEATKIIMEECPTPIIIISSHADQTHSDVTFNALQAGALSVIEKPSIMSDEGYSKIKRQIINEVRTLSSVHVTRRQVKKSQLKVNLPAKPANYKLLALGASTGGPSALKFILSTLPANFPIPIVITQHISDGFLPGLITWLQHSAELSLHIAEANQKLCPGNVYFAPDHKHLMIHKGEGPIAVLDDSSPVDFFKPSATMLFSSIAKSYPRMAIGGLLTGMGRDGAEGLLKMRAAGCATFAQSEVSSVVFGMPGAAASMNAVESLIDLEKIPHYLANLTWEGTCDEEKNIDSG